MLQEAAFNLIFILCQVRPFKDILNVKPAKAYLTYL